MKLLVALIFSSLIVGSLLANHHEAADTYPLKTCVVSGEDLGSMGDSVVIWHKVDGQPDREVRLCCERCEGRFNSNPEKYLATLDTAVTGVDACCADGQCSETKPSASDHSSGPNH